MNPSKFSSSETLSSNCSLDISLIASSRYEAYFEPFHNLPPRSLKDYYRVVSDPVSLRKLQKMVRGTHGRHGSSDFKSWTSFEEKAKLLWKNAYYYNEEGSEIYQLAQELEVGTPKLGFRQLPPPMTSAKPPSRKRSRSS